MNALQQIIEEMSAIYDTKTKLEQYKQQRMVLYINLLSQDRETRLCRFFSRY